MPKAITRETTARVALPSLPLVIFQHVARKRKTSSSVAPLPRKSPPSDSSREVRNGILTLRLKDVARVSRRLFRVGQMRMLRENQCSRPLPSYFILSKLSDRSAVLLSQYSRNAKSCLEISMRKCICNLRM